MGTPSAECRLVHPQINISPMKHKFISQTVWLLVITASSMSFVTAANRVISPAYPTRLLTITEFTYTINNVSFTQTSSAVSTTVVNQPVIAQSITAGGRDLDFFNFAGASLRDINGVFGQSNIQTSDSGIGIVTATSNTSVSSGKAAFDAGLVASTQNSNLLNYIRYDGSNTTPAAAFDFDLLFQKAYEPTDAFLIQERNGNTVFRITPLGINGNPILNANTLYLGGNTDAMPEDVPQNLTSDRYQWNTGFANDVYQKTQPHYFSVFAATEFFAGTPVPTADQIVYGFRIDNNGNADVKFFGLSDDSFDDNPENPLLIPEPTTVLTTTLGLLALLRRRR